MAEATAASPLQLAPMSGTRSVWPMAVGLAFMAAAMVAASLVFGPTGLVWPLLPLAGLDDAARHVLVEIRLPRSLAALVCGAALAMAGTVMQALLRNPLADPGIIGVTPGAALGAVAAIIGGSLLPWAAPLLAHPLAIVGAAFAGGLAATGLLMTLARRAGRTDVTVLLLAGIAVTALAGALTGLAIFAADDRQLRDITFWSLGSLAGMDWHRLGWALPVLLAAIVLMAGLGGALNRLALGEAQAFHMGLDVERAKRRAVLAVAAATGAAVALSGGIAFVGLVVPHVMRLAAGPDNRALLGLSGLAGGGLLVGCDLVARLVVAPAELPIGILTALLGAPVFLWLLLGRAAAIRQPG